MAKKALSYLKRYDLGHFTVQRWAPKTPNIDTAMPVDVFSSKVSKLSVFRE